MKRIFSIYVFLLMLGVAAAQQSTNNVASNTIEETKAKAEKGDAEAQYSLGVRYDNGDGVAKDEIEAVKWYRKAAEQNYASAQYNLGLCYYNGQGVAKD